MNDDERRLRELPPRSLEDLLCDLARANVSELRGEHALLSQRPRVTLHLRSGRSLSGMVTQATRDALEAGGGSCRITFQEDAKTRGEPPCDLVYLATDAIEAVTVHDAGRHARVVAGEEPGA